MTLGLFEYAQPQLRRLQADLGSLGARQLLEVAYGADAATLLAVQAELQGRLATWPPDRLRFGLDGRHVLGLLALARGAVCGGLARGARAALRAAGQAQDTPHTVTGAQLVGVVRRLADRAVLYKPPGRMAKVKVSLAWWVCPACEHLQAGRSTKITARCSCGTLL